MSRGAERWQGEEQQSYENSKEFLVFHELKTCFGQVGTRKWRKIQTKTLRYSDRLLDVLCEKLNSKDPERKENMFVLFGVPGLWQDHACYFFFAGRD